jgi:hypothetical protein
MERTTITRENMDESQKHYAEGDQIQETTNYMIPYILHSRES